MEKKNPIEEARRYVANAKETIAKADLDTKLGVYNDRKYVRMAGNTLWNGCLIALEAVFNLKTGKGRPSIDKYKEAATKRDKKLLASIEKGYDTMHLSMGYDGTKDPDVCKKGFATANDIIDRCAMLLK